MNEIIKIDENIGRELHYKEREKLTDEMKVVAKNQMVPNPLTPSHLAGPWTCLWDMHSGGKTKESPFDKIYIQAGENEAKIIFYNIFGHNPDRVTCTCCGEDYSIHESVDLLQASGYHRNCDCKDNAYLEADQTGRFKTDRPFTPIEQYVLETRVLCIFAHLIKPEWRIGEVPRQGYVWQE